MPELRIIPAVQDGELAPYMTPGQEPEALVALAATWGTP